jgi:hypothetical protein
MGGSTQRRLDACMMLQSPDGVEIYSSMAPVGYSLASKLHYGECHGMTGMKFAFCPVHTPRVTVLACSQPAARSLALPA